jgi:hypothetical protein
MAMNNNNLIQFDNNLDGIKSARMLCHSLSVGAILIGGLVWSLPPFLIQGKSNLAIVGRYMSLLGTAGAGAILLVTSSYLKRTNTIVVASQVAAENLLIEQLTYSQFAQQTYFETLSKELPPILANKAIDESLGYMIPKNDLPAIPAQNTGAKIMIAPQNYQQEQGEIEIKENDIIDDLPPDLLAILNLAREQGGISIRDVQRSSIGKKMKLTADGARYAFERLSDLGYGEVEIKKTTVKFVPFGSELDNDTDD